VQLRERRGGTPSQGLVTSIVYVGRAVLVLGLALMHSTRPRDED
jgi:hypothetical protein